MIHLAWPWLLTALPLPLLARFLLPPAAPPQAALRIPFFGAVADLPAAGRARRAPLLTGGLCWLLLLLAAARPQWVGEPRALPLSGRDLLLAVDVSASMRTDDMLLDGVRVDRLRMIQAIAGDFLRRRRGDRVGLILFGSRAYLQAPLTYDRLTVSAMLAEAEIGLAGRETAIGDAIALAVKRLIDDQGTRPDSPPRRAPVQPLRGDQVLVLLTDGTSNTGELSPAEAAEIAARLGLKIYTIGIGADARVVASIFGTRRIDPATDLDEQTLRQIADRTGGAYFRARSSSELASIYQTLDSIEPRADEDQRYRPVVELYHWPLALALALSVLLALPAVAAVPATFAAPRPPGRTPEPTDGRGRVRPAADTGRPTGPMNTAR